MAKLLKETVQNVINNNINNIIAGTRNIRRRNPYPTCISYRDLLCRAKGGGVVIYLLRRRTPWLLRLETPAARNMLC